MGMPSKIISLRLLVKTRLLNKSGSILESKGMGAIFQKREKCKGSCLRAIIVRNKLLAKVLEVL